MNFIITVLATALIVQGINTYFYCTAIQRMEDWFRREKRRFKETNKNEAIYLPQTNKYYVPLPLKDLELINSARLLDYIWSKDDDDEN